MKKTKIAGGILILLGALLMLIPTLLFPGCEGLIERADGGASMPMRCHWTGLAEVGIGILILCAGLLSLAAKTGGAGVFAMATACGVVGVLLPIKLIGVCAMPTMACRSAMAPAIYVSCALVIVTGLVGALLAGQKSRQGT